MSVERGARLAVLSRDSANWLAGNGNFGNRLNRCSRSSAFAWVARVPLDLAIPTVCVGQRPLVCVQIVCFRVHYHITNNNCLIASVSLLFDYVAPTDILCKNQTADHGMTFTVMRMIQLHVSCEPNPINYFQQHYFSMAELAERAAAHHRSPRSAACNRTICKRLCTVLCCQDFYLIS